MAEPTWVRLDVRVRAGIRYVGVLALYWRRADGPSLSTDEVGRIVRSPAVAGAEMIDKESWFSAPETWSFQRSVNGDVAIEEDDVPEAVRSHYSDADANGARVIGVRNLMNDIVIALLLL